MNMYLEIFGYAGTALVLLSMMMTSLLKLRVFNICGSVISMIYAFLSGAMPVVLLNFGLIIINAAQLVRLMRPKNAFAVRSLRGDECAFDVFNDCYGEDIKNFFPEYKRHTDDSVVIYMVYSGAEPVGMLIGREDGGTMLVDVDYSVPGYRDLSVARYLFDELKARGISKLCAVTDVQTHRRYLLKMGFKERDGVMLKAL